MRIPQDCFAHFVAEVLGDLAIEHLRSGHCVVFNALRLVRWWQSQNGKLLNQDDVASSGLEEQRMQLASGVRSDLDGQVGYI